MSKSLISMLLGVLLIPALLSGQTTRPHLHRLFGIASEDGIIAIEGNTVSVFSSENVRLQNEKSLNWQLANTKNGAISIQATSKGWRETGVPLPISSAHGFALCDRLNQVDLSSLVRNLRLALPKGAKVKSFIRIDENVNLIIYSVSANQVRYDVRVGLVEHEASGAYSLTANDLATDAGNFCGIQQGEGDLFFVFADEPSGSSDFSSVYAYAVNRGQ